MQPQDLALLGLAAFAFWLLIVRPSQQRKAAQRALAAKLVPGRRVMTAGGIFGTVSSVTDDTVWVEVAPGVVIELLTQAIARVVDETGPDRGSSDDQLDQVEAAGGDAEPAVAAAADDEERDRG